MNLTDVLADELSRSFAATPAVVVAIRLFAAMALGALIGVEREMKDRPAGLRTHILVSVAACLFTLIGFEIMAVTADDAATKATDPLRLIEAVTAGVAFLAAGTIFTARGSVQGLTTGAGLWMAGAVGLSCGIGQYALAAMAAVGTLIVLAVLGVVVQGRNGGSGSGASGGTVALGLTDGSRRAGAEAAGQSGASDLR